MQSDGDKREAAYYRKLDNNQVKCLLCPHECVIAPGKSGICQGRKNIKGILYAENYAKVSSIGIDPVEKKPLYHFYPASKILSAGTYGCNFRCSFCQNWQISQQKPQLRYIPPEELVQMALQNECIGIAFTYSEPLVWYEYVLETAKLSREKGLKNVLVSNGYLNPSPLKDLIPLIDGANIDLKAFSDDFYNKISGGSLEPVLGNIKELFKGGVHLELTTLIIPELNDSREEISTLLKWIKELDSGIPLHLSRYFPRYKLEKEATAPELMENIYQMAIEKLDYVYLGNLNTERGMNTYCPDCGELLIRRSIYNVDNRLERDKCPECAYQIKGLF